MVADTSAFIALFVMRDKDHARVREFLRQKNLWLLTSTVILAELYTHLRYSSGFASAIEVHDRLVANPAVRVVPWGEEMDALTYNVLRRLPGLSMSYEDASLIALAESEGIQDVLSLDNDFRLAGLNLLPG